MTKAKVLYQLQIIDSEKDTKQDRLAEIEEALKDRQALDQAHQRLENAKKQAQKWLIRQRDLELEVQSLSDRITDSENRLYSGKVTNPKELADLQAEVASLKRRRQKLEDKLLETMIEREEAETARDQAEANLEEVESRRSIRQADLKAEREELQTRLGEIKEKRSDLLSRIEAVHLSAYQDLREQKSGLAVVQMKDGICQGCGVTVSPSLEWELRQGKLINCDNCGRILTRP